MLSYIINGINYPTLNRNKAITTMVTRPFDDST